MALDQWQKFVDSAKPTDEQVLALLSALADAQANNDAWNAEVDRITDREERHAFYSSSKERRNAVENQVREVASKVLSEDQFGEFSVRLISVWAFVDSQPLDLPESYRVADDDIDPRLLKMME